MKVAFVLSHPADPRIYRRMMALMEYHEVVLVYWDRCLDVADRNSVPDGVTARAIRIPAPQGQWARRILPLITFCARAIAVLRTARPDTLHCDNLDMLMVGCVYRLLVNRRVKLVYEVADLSDTLYGSPSAAIRRIISRILAGVEQSLCQNIQLLVVTSPFFYERHYSGFIPESRVLFLPNAPEKRVFEGYTRLDHEGFTVGFIGLVRYPRQVRMLVDATDGIPEVGVLIAGNGVAYEEIREYCRGRSHVEFHGPYDYEDEIASLYSKVDCVYAVYDTSIANVRIALPNRLYEAIVCGIPIITAEGTELGKFVEKHAIGFAVPDDDLNALRITIRRLLTDTEALATIRQRLARMKDRYFAEAGYAELLRRYAELKT